jgi:hypothetical protein
MAEDPNNPNNFRYNYGLGAASGSTGDYSNQTLNDLLNFTVDDPTGLEQSEYDFNYRVFPEDLTMSDSAHYMVININVPVHIGGQNRSAYSYRTNILNKEFSKVDNLRFNPQIDAQNPDIPTGTGGVVAEALAIPRSTRRIKESIALHMPNGGLVYTEDNKYEEASMTAIGSSLLSSLRGENGVLGGAAATAVDIAGQIVKNGSRLAGYSINPRVEVLFATRPQRQWMFELFLAPRSPTEAQTVREIIKTLRYHAAPELGYGGFYFIPPAEFDITFFRQGVENQNLPRINTCVLERIDIDYAPQSGAYSTFKDGSPVAVRLSLGFREIEIVHKRRVLEGF